MFKVFAENTPGKKYRAGEAAAKKAYQTRGRQPKGGYKLPGGVTLVKNAGTGVQRTGR